MQSVAGLTLWYSHEVDGVSAFKIPAVLLGFCTLCERKTDITHTNCYFLGSYKIKNYVNSPPSNNNESGDHSPDPYYFKTLAESMPPKLKAATGLVNPSRSKREEEIW